MEMEVPFGNPGCLRCTFGQVARARARPLIPL